MASADAFARPDSDPSVRWVTTVGDPPCEDLNTFNCVDELVRDDSDYVESIGLGSGGQDIQEYTLSDIADPLQSNGHVLRYAISEGNSGTNPVGLTVQLRQGVTEIASWTHAQGTIPTTFTLFQQTLNSTEADSITDYSDLELTFTATCETGCGNSPSNREEVLLSWVEFAVIMGVSPPTLNAVNVVNTTALQPVWTEPLDLTDVQFYEIQRNDGLGFNGIINVTNGTTSYIDNGLIPESFHEYRILTVGSSMKSAPSNVLNGTTGDVVALPKISRPNNDPDLRWVNAVGCSGLQTHQCVDEVVRDDNDYVETVGLGLGGADTQFYEMSDISDPFQSTGHVLRYTVMEAGDGTNQPQLTVILRQGVTPIATFVHPQGSLPSTFTLVQQELTPVQADLITDYSSLELTLLAECLVNCSNGVGNIERVRVSWIEFEIISPFKPNLKNAETLSSSSIRLNWEISDPDDISTIIIQRANASNFIPIANVASLATTFDDTGLQSQKTFRYKIQVQLQSGGFSEASKTVQGSTPPDESTLNTQGVIIEPNPSNSFNNLESDVIAQTVELFNLNSTTMDLIIDDIEVQNLNAYQIINKMNNGSYDNSVKTRTAGAFYGNIYLELSDIDQFITDIQSRILQVVNSE